MHHKETEINGRRVAYYGSEGKGRPVLFIHGNSMSGLCFEGQLESPLGRQYRLVALDLPGHGSSAPAPDPRSACTLPAYATLVSGFAGKLGIADALLVGWSLGGHVLLEAISSLPESPGLMIFGAPPVGNPMAADAFIPHPLMPLLFKNDLTGEEAAAISAAFLKPGGRTPDFMQNDMRRTDGRVRESLGLSIAEGNYSDEVAIVANLDKPLAVVHGESDSLVSLSYLGALSIPALWRSEIQIVPDAGHSPHWEQPEKFNSLLTEFISEISL